ncbi:acyl-CoA thioesterase domain-containing protein [Saccharopolyspora shandongensis]|uniref:acyl-CoA thioesterase domain-containing protein n=1 Tax=Saccharopolyspora shandongensis TaxID=418495 RepID=UPI00343F0142
MVIEHDNKNRSTPMALFWADTHADGEVLVPQQRARSQWSNAGQLRGAAVSGALARAAERAANGLPHADGFRAVRWTLDLFRPAATMPCRTQAAVVRQGRRLRLVDATILQEDKVVARASLLLLAGRGRTSGTTWAGPRTHPSTPPPGLRPATTEPTLYFSEEIGWTDTPAPHHNASRKMTWHLPAEIVADEPVTPFQHVASIADASNLVANWGDSGVEYINADVSLHLLRIPHETDGVGISALERAEEDGIALATTVLYDRNGHLGQVELSAIANGANAVDPRKFGL